MWKKLKTLPATGPLYFYLPLALCAILSMILSLDFLFDLLHFPPDDISDRDDPKNIYVKCFLFCLLGPLLETAFFQMMPFYFLSLFDFMKRHVWLIILIPAVPFGLLHAFGIRYQITAIGLGCIFMYTYWVRSKKGDPFLSTFLLHCSSNAVALTMSLLYGV
jgi:hypothetical protein